MLAACVACHSPAPAHHDDLAQQLEAIRAKYGVPGMGVAIVHGNDVEIAVAGTRRVDRPAKLTKDDRFHLGSDTKAITASVVARLVDRGVLRWNETLAEALPDITAMDPAFRTVTIDMLLRHEAGFAEGGAFTPEFTQGFDDEHWPLDKQRAWMADRFLSRPPHHPPGSKFQYSNYDYLIAGAIVEHATGKTWEQLAQQEVFTPLGMTGCGFGATATAAHPDDNWAHDLKNGKYVPTEEDNPPLIGPAGTAYCPLAAWAKFAAAHAGDPPPGWLRPETLAHLHEPKTLAEVTSGKDIALGWGVTHDTPRRLTHSGSNGYNDAEIVVIPDRHAALLVTANAGDPQAMAASKAVIELLVPRL